MDNSILVPMQLSKVECTVLQILYDSMNGMKIVNNLSQIEIADKTGFCRSSVISAIDKLRKQKIIKLVQRNQHNKFCNNNVYQVLI